MKAIKAGLRGLLILVHMICAGAAMLVPIPLFGGKGALGILIGGIAFMLYIFSTVKLLEWLESGEFWES